MCAQSKRHAAYSQATAENVIDELRPAVIAPERAFLVAGVTERARALARLRDAPLDLLPESGSESLDGRELCVHPSRLEASDGRL